MTRASRQQGRAWEYYTQLTADDFEELPGSNEDGKIESPLRQHSDTPSDPGAASRMGIAIKKPLFLPLNAPNHADAASRGPCHERAFPRQIPEDMKDWTTEEADTIFDADDESSSEDAPLRTPNSSSDVSASKSEALKQKITNPHPSGHELNGRDFADFCAKNPQSRHVSSQADIILYGEHDRPDGPVIPHRASQQRPGPQTIEWEDETSGRRDSSAPSDLAEPASHPPQVQEPETSQSSESAVPPVKVHADEAGLPRSADESPEPNAPTVSEKKDDLPEPTDWKLLFWLVQLIFLLINLCTASGHAPFRGICDQGFWAAFLAALPLVQLVSLFFYCLRRSPEGTVVFLGFLLVGCPLWLNSSAGMYQMCAHVDTSRWVARDTVLAMVVNVTRGALANHTAVRPSIVNSTRLNANSANTVTNITSTIATNAEDAVRLALEDVMRTINTTVDDVVRQLAENGNKPVFV